MYTNYLITYTQLCRVSFLSRVSISGDINMTTYLFNFVRPSVCPSVCPSGIVSNRLSTSSYFLRHNGSPIVLQVVFPSTKHLCEIPTGSPYDGVEFATFCNTGRNQGCHAGMFGPRQTILTLYGHIKTAEQRTIIQQYGDQYTGS